MLSQGVISSEAGGPLPFDGRLVLKCYHCRLTQFLSKSGLCKRCRKPVGVAASEEEWRSLNDGSIVMLEMKEERPKSFPIDRAVREVRIARGLTQREVARRMGMPRTYISKVENGNASPSLESLERIALALRITVHDLVFVAEKIDDAPLRAIFGDALASSLLPYVHSLTTLQMNKVLWALSHRALEQYVV